MSKIISLQASNFKKLSAIQITPEGNVITLTGDNGAGKSSVLDAIQSALAGGKTIPEEPIRRGEDRGQVVLQLDGALTITRSFTAGGSTLRITDADGNVQRTPQGILDKLLGNLAFDPLAFSRLKAAEQWEQLRELVGLDFKQLDIDRARKYDERTIINREILRLQTLLREIPTSVDDAPDETVSTAEVLTEITDAISHNSSIDHAEQTIQQAEKEYNAAGEAVSEAEKNIEDWTTELKLRRGLASEAHHKLDVVKGLNTLIRADVDILKQKLGALEIVNEAARAKKARTAMVESVKTEQSKSDVLSSDLLGIDTIKTQAIANAKFPLSELSYDGEAIVYRGIRFAQVSDGEKLRVSAAVCMALNPKLRVMFIRDGSLLDKAGLQTISDLASANDYQIWIEDTRSADPAAIELVDGAIKA